MKKEDKTKSVAAEKPMTLAERWANDPCPFRVLKRADEDGEELELIEGEPLLKKKENH